jgi:hypothetical protein
MTTPTLDCSPTRAELELLMRMAVLQAGTRNVGRERAARVTHRLSGRLAAVAAAVAVYDLGLLLSAL